jgi:hypothetical protein
VLLLPALAAFLVGRRKHDADAPGTNSSDQRIAA